MLVSPIPSDLIGIQKKKQTDEEEPVQEKPTGTKFQIKHTYMFQTCT